jgi:pantoate--beta-alanine ligase
VFGRKDYQQLKVIERMARDLLIPVEVLGHKTVREADGLAMSSRNRYLSDEHRARAAQIPRALSCAVRSFQAGERSVEVLRNMVLSPIKAMADRVDYVEVANPDTLVAYRPGDTIESRALLALAARVGPARLIDNVVLGEDSAPCGEDSA